MITPDYHCVDAGANIGFHSIQFGKLGKKVYSFEPQRYVFNQMSANILINDLDNQINTYRLGLGDKEELLRLFTIVREKKYWDSFGFTSIKFLCQISDKIKIILSEI